jgi:uncharacterized protein
MEPFYFGTDEKRLFGIHHAPARGARRSSAVVLCYPMGPEYFIAHRAFRQLSLRLAEAGFHVLRFDFYGCGDSAGESDEGEVKQWLEDIGAAVDEIKDLSGAAKVSLTGARLGATLSALAASRRADVESIVLWDPIVKGAAYVRELEERHKDWMRNVLPQPTRINGDDEILEIAGFPLTGTLRSGIEELDLSGVREFLPGRLFIVETSVPSMTDRWREQMKRLGVGLDYQLIPGPKRWIQGRQSSRALVPNPVLQSIASWLAKVCP